MKFEIFFEERSFCVLEVSPRLFRIRFIRRGAALFFRTARGTVLSQYARRKCARGVSFLQKSRLIQRTKSDKGRGSV